MDPKRKWIVPAVVAAIVFLSFVRTLGADFLNWDDDVGLTDNPYYRGLSAENLAWMFTTFDLGHYQPLTWMTLGLDYVIWGMDPTGYHLTNVLIHAANGVLLYFVLLALIRQPLAAAAGALFWAVHPLRVESVAWITERRDVLCGLFVLLTVLSYLRMASERDAGGPWGRWLAISLACFAGSLLSKALGIMLPAVLLAMDVWPLRRFVPGARVRLLMEKAPFLALAAADAAVMLLAMRDLDAVRSMGGYDFSQRIMQAAYGLFFYVWKTVIPVGLSPLYPIHLQMDPWDVKYVACLAAVVAGTGALVAFRKKWPAGLVAWFCYGALVFPVLGLVVCGQQLAADRYTYLACLPFSALWAAAVVRFRAASFAIPVLAALTLVQTGHWMNSLRLWDRVIEIEPSTPVAYLNRAATLMESGDPEAALIDLNVFLKNEPESDKLLVKGLWNRGLAYERLGDAVNAERDYGRIIEIEPDHLLSRFRRGVVRAPMGNLPGAIKDFEETLRRAPPDWKTRAEVRRFLDEARRRGSP